MQVIAPYTVWRNCEYRHYTLLNALKMLRFQQRSTLRSALFLLAAASLHPQVSRLKANAASHLCNFQARSLQSSPASTHLSDSLIKGSVKGRRFEMCTWYVLHYWTFFFLNNSVKYENGGTFTAVRRLPFQKNKKMDDSTACPSIYPSISAQEISLHCKLMSNYDLELNMMPWIKGRSCRGSNQTPATL